MVKRRNSTSVQCANRLANYEYISEMYEIAET